MKIGYPCLNHFLGIKNKSFRLASYSEKRLVEAIAHNLDYLHRMLLFNIEHRLLFFHISSDIVPFASHPICRYKWWDHFQEKFIELGHLIRHHNIRISMHPDQFVIINSMDKDIYSRSVNELLYHARVLNLMQLDRSAKIQLHVGGVYNNKPESLKRFISGYHQLEPRIRERLVVENDDCRYNFSDCFYLYEQIGIPVLFDVFHHEVNNSGENLQSLLKLQASTWNISDGLPMVDFSQQKPAGKTGAHADAIDINGFTKFLRESQPYNFDIMLEIKDKEKSAIKAIEVARNDPRFFNQQA